MRQAGSGGWLAVSTHTHTHTHTHAQHLLSKQEEFLLNAFKYEFC